MSEFRFIHASDLHIGSQLQKLELYPGSPVEKMRSAPQRAVENLVELAIEHQVQALLIAGDLFDGPWPDIRVGLWMIEQMRRLERENIPVFCIRGNHDALSVVSSSIDWPKNVFEFKNQAETAPVLDCGLAVHGRSFLLPRVTEDIAASYPSAIAGAFNVGLLHTSLTGSTQHDPYAPTDIRVLNDRGYGYWGLGHIHMRTEHSLSDACWVGYSGNTQGRNVREAGPKGCYLVDVHDQKISQVRFLTTDVARWSTLPLDLTSMETMEEVKVAAREAIETLVTSHEGRVTAVRILCEGATAMHAALGTPSSYEDLRQSLRTAANEIDNAWIEKVEIRTCPPRSAEALQRSQMLFAEIAAAALEWKESTDWDSNLEAIRELLNQKIAPELKDLGWTTELSPEWKPDWNRITEQAEQYLEGSLLGGIHENS